MLPPPSPPPPQQPSEAGSSSGPLRSNRGAIAGAAAAAGFLLLTCLVIFVLISRRRAHARADAAEAARWREITGAKRRNAALKSLAAFPQDSLATSNTEQQPAHQEPADEQQDGSATVLEVADDGIAVGTLRAGDVLQARPRDSNGEWVRVRWDK